MKQPTPLDDKDQEDLSAFLDGELDEATSQALEARMTLDSHVRAEADSLRKAWDLLDHLPRSEPSPDFTQRTMHSIAVVTATAPRLRWRRWRPLVFGLCWAAS